MNIKRDIRFRVYVAFTGICLLGLAILAKATLIQVKEGPKLRKVAMEMHTDTATLRAERGNIFTEDGVLLCSSIPQFDIYIDFSVIKPKLFNDSVGKLCQDLATLFHDQTAAQYLQEFKEAYDSTDRYYFLHRNIPYYQFQQLRTFPIFNKGKAYGGLIAITKIKRDMPFGTLAGSVIGKWRDSGTSVGLEESYDSLLTGENGSCVVQKQPGGWVPIEGSELEPVNGEDIVTTIDVAIQSDAEMALKSVLEHYKCQYGTCIVMEVQTGKIRALVNLGEHKDGSFFEDPDFLNYALAPTEPGSTFKLATLISILSDKFVTINSIVDAKGGEAHFGSFVVKDSHKGLGKITIKKAFAESSNAAFATLANGFYTNDPERFYDHLQSLGLGKRTGLDIPNEHRPKITPFKDWQGSSLPAMGMGYDVQISPMHTCMMYNAIANNGRMMRPYLVSSVREYGKDVKTFSPKAVSEKIADSATIAQVKECMEEVVLDGTAKTIKSPYYSIAGKTGTAKVADRGISYKDGIYQGSFVGFFPADRPKYTIAIVVRTKKGSTAYYGAAIAAPVFKVISDRVFANGMGAWSGPLDSLSKLPNKPVVAKDATASSYRYLLNNFGLKADVDDIPQAAISRLMVDSSKKLVLRSEQVTEGVVPNVKGMGLKDAVYLLENQGMQVIVRGAGRVQAQSVAPGSKFSKGQNIILQLS